MNICVFGDSIAWGANDHAHGGWVERLKARYIADAHGVRVYNLGISNDDTQKLLARIEAEAHTRAPKIIVFAIGINDASYLGSLSTPRISSESFRENLAQLTARARTVADTLIWVGLARVDEAKTMPVPYAPDQYYGNIRIAEYDDEIRTHCAQGKMLYIPVAEIVTPADLEDGIHPNSEGHRKMFEAVHAALKI